MKLSVRIFAMALLLAFRRSRWRKSIAAKWIDGLTASEKQGDIPVGTKITMSNWQQYQQFMPFGMVQLFEGKYQWKMPSDVEMDVGPTHQGGNLPKTWVEATEKYGSQTDVEVMPNGHYLLKNYHGGTPFPNPSDPNKGWKVMANVFFAYTPAMYVKTPNNYGTVWSSTAMAISRLPVSMWSIAGALILPTKVIRRPRPMRRAPGTPSG